MLFLMLTIIKRKSFHQDWVLFVDGSSNTQASGTGLVLTTLALGQARIKYALHFGYLLSNNEVEYETLLARLRLTAALGVQKLVIYSNSQLVVNKVTSVYQAREGRMEAYLI